MRKISDFFYFGNAVSGDPDYGFAETFVRTAEAFANTTYQSVYIIDYYRKNFLYVSPNPLFLCGMSPEQVQQLGYQFYLDHVPDEEVDMLLEINRAGSSFINKVEPSEKKYYTITYDFHLVNGKDKILINHKLTGLAYQPDGSMWLGLSVISLSTHSKAGHAQIHCRNRSDYWEYSLVTHRWKKRSMPILSPSEKMILTLSTQGLTMNSIAECVHLSLDTVKSTRCRIFKKLEVNNISEAISYAINYKLI